MATHVPSGSKYGTTSRDNGDYNLPGLRVGGPYKITVSSVGYATDEYTDITLQLSQSLRQDFRLVEEAVRLGEVVVTAERSAVLNAARSGAATNVMREQIDRLPTLSRNFQDYYKLSPYFSGNNAVGRSSRYNNIQVDGANFNDLFGLGGTGAPAGQSSVTPISLDAIEEFQIVVSPYDVRQAGFTGAGINAITRSGTNTFKGSAFYFGRNETFVGVSPDTLKTKLQDFKDYQAGFRVGGPIMKDKLFFFTSGEITRYNQPLTRIFGNTSFGSNAFTVSEDSLNLLTNYLMSKYGYDPGAWKSMSFLRESDKMFARLDYNISDNHKLTARWNYLKSLEDNTPSRGRGALDIYAEFGRYKLVNTTHTFAVQLTSLFGNTASNEFILGYVNQFDNPIYYGQPFPTLYIRTSNPAATDKRTQNLVLGAEQFRHRNELEQDYFEITNNFSLYLPGHMLTVGARVDLFKFRNLFIPSNFGVYTYNSIFDFINDKKPASYEYRYSATANPLQEANWGAPQFGFYVQDEWTVSPALKLTGGIRFDVPIFTDKANYNPRVDSTFTALGYDLGTDKNPKTAVSVSPRLGFNWALDEERNTQLRGGVGIFYGRFPMVWVSNQYSNTGVDFITTTTVPSNFTANPFNQPGVGTITTAEVNLTDRNFKAPSIFRGNLAVDHQLPFYLVASVEGIFSKSQNEVYYKNINLKGLQTNAGLTPNGKLNGENREVWGTWNATARRYEFTNVTGGKTTGPEPVNNRFTPGVYLVTNTDQGSNMNFLIQLQRQNAPDGIDGTIAYTWGQAKDIGGVNSATARSGWRFNPTHGDPNNPKLSYADFDLRHRVLGTISYRHDWGWMGLATTFGLFYEGLSGRPFSYMVDGDVNGDGERDNDLAYIPKDANDIILVSSTGAVLPKTDAAYAALFAYINGDAYLKANKGKISERNGARQKWNDQVDLRISQEVPVISGHKLELTFDILNTMNMLNNDWGWNYSIAHAQVFLMQFHSIETTAGANYGKPRYRWLGVSDPNVPGNITSRWQAQLGIRYTF